VPCDPNNPSFEDEENFARSGDEPGGEPSLDPLDVASGMVSAVAPERLEALAGILYELITNEQDADRRDFWETVYEHLQ
jgi:hypothetical protein